MQDHHAPRGYVPLELNDDAQLVFMLGSTFNNGRASLTPERADDLCRRYRVWMDAKVRKNVKPHRLTSMLQGACGEFRNLLAMLLWINQPAVHTIIDKPAVRGWFNKKPVAYAQHHVVQMRKELNHRAIVKAFAPRRAPRRHEVEAFWRNYDKTPGCIHEWPLFPDERGHFQCQRCPQWRTRVKQHERGDAAIGFVTKEYTT